MFPMRYVAQLIGDNAGSANPSFYVTMWVAVYPEVNAAVGNEIAKFHSERAIDRAVPKFFSRALLRGYVMGEYNFLQPFVIGFRHSG